MNSLLHFVRNKRCSSENSWSDGESAFEVYDYVLMEARQAAEYFEMNYRAEAVERQDILFEAQTRLHARAYRTTWEIRALLLSGNPDGALARWRTLYELQIVMLFLEKHGPDTADRYLRYDTVQTARNMNQYEQYREKLGHEPLAQDQVEAIQQERDDFLKEWQAPDRENYAWAAKALNLTNPKASIGFDQLERDVELEHMRLYYNIASNHIHANAKGLNEDHWADMVPSMRRFSLAGYEGMARLANCTKIMIRLRPSEETKRLTSDLDKLLQTGADRFQEIERQLEHD